MSLDKGKQGYPHVITYSESAYSLIIRNRTPTVRPGDKVEIDLFLSGYGIPEKNKLDIKWSSPYIINRENAGFLEWCISLGEDTATGKIMPLTGTRFRQSLKITPIGIDTNLVQSFFFKNPVTTDSPNFAFAPVISESLWDNNPPMYLSLNTANSAPPGDYDITFTFTYGNEQNIFQDQKAARFHVTNWWERNQGWIAIAGATIALLSLIATAVFSIWRP